jgi:FtsP/CotA-like multicopper oxidase with cupredoxin domain
MSDDDRPSRLPDDAPEPAAEETPEGRPARSQALSRRSVLRTAALGGGVLATGSAALIRSALQSPGRAATGAAKAGRALHDPVPGGTLDPTTVPKYVTALPILAAMPRTGTVSGGSVDFYTIAARQFRQQVLPGGYPATSVWGYGSTSATGAFHAPAFTIETQVGRQVRVVWANQLVDSNGNFLPHPLTVDPTLHWTNPPGGISGRDSTPSFSSTPAPYTGPVPLVTHLHGAHSQPDSDGYPEAWYLPVARNIPSGYATIGTWYNTFKSAFAHREGVNWSPGTATFQYTNDQRATALWFHDHALGMTRVNVHMGLAGYFMVRGGSSDLPSGVLPGPAPRRGDPPGTKYYEIPMIIQDRSFNADGSIFFPTTRGTFGDTPPDGPWIPNTDVPPYWNPESFGSVICVNGRSWPQLQVEPRRYRFRFLNNCNARTVIMKIVTDPLTARPATAALPFWHIGSDGGFLRAPAQADKVLLHVAERSDVIVDFTGLKPGTQLYLINEGPDEAFGGGVPNTDFDPADPGTSGQVMKFLVVPLASKDTSVPPSKLTLPPLARLGAETNTRHLSLNEIDSQFFAGAPIVGLLGTVNADGSPNPLDWAAAVTENPALNTTEVWELHNFTEDAHPIHIHQVQFEVVNRQPVGGSVTQPEVWETGTKDTVIAYPDQFTRVRARFDISGRYVWHCHILDHEDHDMMRPYQVGS